MLRSPRIQPSAPTSNAPRTLATSPNSTSAPSFSRYTEPCSFIPHRTSTPSANTSLNHCLLSLNSGADGISYFGCRGRKIEEREPPGVVRARQDRRALSTRANTAGGRQCSSAGRAQWMLTAYPRPRLSRRESRSKMRKRMPDCLRGSARG